MAAKISEIPTSVKKLKTKIILTLDRFTVGDYEGIQVVNALDWLLEA